MKGNDLIRKGKCVQPAQRIEQTLYVNDIDIKFESDTDACENFVSRGSWLRFGKPLLEPTTKSFQSASGHNLPTLGLFKPGKVAVITEIEDAYENFEEIYFIVTSTLNLDLLGRNGISNLKISVDALIFPDKDILQTVNQVNCHHDNRLQQACERLQ